MGRKYYLDPVTKEKIYIKTTVSKPPVIDVQVDGNSVLEDRIAKINLSDKQDVIPDIDTIRTNAAAGAASAEKVNVSAGNATQPIYFDNGAPVATTHTLDTSVPADAKFTDTTYTASDGVTITGTNITNSGVRSVGEGSVNGTIRVDTGGTAKNIYVKGLGSAAFTSSDKYAAATHGHAIADVTGLQTALDNKQDTISDLDTIRTNASKGATALQSVPSEYITETELNNILVACTDAEIDAIFA